MGGLCKQEFTGQPVLVDVLIFSSGIVVLGVGDNAALITFIIAQLCL